MVFNIMVILNKSELTLFYRKKKLNSTLLCNQEVCKGLDLMFLIIQLFYHPPAGSASWQISLSLWKLQMHLKCSVWYRWHLILLLLIGALGNVREAVILQAVVFTCIPRSCVKAQACAYREALRLSVTAHNKWGCFLTSACVFRFSPLLNIWNNKYCGL